MSRCYGDIYKGRDEMEGVLQKNLEYCARDGIQVSDELLEEIRSRQTSKGLSHTKAAPLFLGLTDPKAILPSLGFRFQKAVLLMSVELTAQKPHVLRWN